jgi:phosphodiesterase/alkaline phosphatase D-like protein
VVWETDISCPGEVVYGETLEYGSSAADPIVGARHAVTLTNLTPYTTYQYRVESGGVPLSENATFRSAAGPDQTEFTFVAFGDCRLWRYPHPA